MPYIGSQDVQREGQGKTQGGKYKKGGHDQKKKVE